MIIVINLSLLPCATPLGLSLARLHKFDFEWHISYLECRLRSFRCSRCRVSITCWSGIRFTFPLLRTHAELKQTCSDRLSVVQKCDIMTAILQLCGLRKLYSTKQIRFVFPSGKSFRNQHDIVTQLTTSPKPAGSFSSDQSDAVTGNLEVILQLPIVEYRRNTQKSQCCIVATKWWMLLVDTV